MENAQKIMLHVGCGHDYLDGWINIDDNFEHNIKKLDMTLNLNEILPFAPKSIDIIYDRRFFEKLRLGSDFLEQLFINYRYILKDEGMLRILIPDSGSKENIKQVLESVGFNNIEIIELDFLETTKVQESTQKIPCYVLVFFDFETTRKSLEFLTKYNDRLDIRVVENNSENTENFFRPYISKLLDDGEISKYYLFNENIGFNAMEKIIINDSEYINQHKYFIITDGDLTSKDENWIDEQINILENNKEVVVSGVKLDMTNLPSEKLYPNAKNWVPPAKEISGKNYLDGNTGWVLTMLKTDYFFLIMRMIRNSGTHISDFRVNQFVTLLNKKWVRTKNSEAYHLTWDVYSQIEHPYTKWKMAHTYKEIWEHDKTCDFISL